MERATNKNSFRSKFHENIQHSFDKDWKVHACTMIYASTEIHIATICQNTASYDEWGKNLKQTRNFSYALLAASINGSFPLSKCLLTDVMMDQWNILNIMLGFGKAVRKEEEEERHFFLSLHEWKLRIAESKKKLFISSIKINFFIFFLLHIFYIFSPFFVEHKRQGTFSSQGFSPLFHFRKPKQISGEEKLNEICLP